MSPRQPTNRREFLCACARYGLVGALAALAGRLVAREAANGPDPAERCVGAGACRGCAALPRCPLPNATDARNAARSL